MEISKLFFFGKSWPKRAVELFLVTKATFKRTGLFLHKNFIIDVWQGLLFC